MQKAEPQHRQTQNHSAAKQMRNTAASPKGGRIAQLSDLIHSSPHQAAQRKKFDSLFGTTQRMMEDEPIQHKLDTAQRAMEEEPVQGKFVTVQRIGEEEPLQGKFDAVQRVEEEEPIQHKLATAQRAVEEEPLQHKLSSGSPAQLEQHPVKDKPNNTGLPDNLKSGIENLSGMSMDNVQVHYNSSRPAQLNALAYAQGTDIHVAPGQEQHLPHEAWHIVQQAQGRVRPTMQMKGGVPVNDDKGLEHEADVMGGRALQMTGRAAGIEHSSSRSQGTLPVIIQRLLEKPTDEEIRERFRKHISFEKGTCDGKAVLVASGISRWNDEYAGEKNGYSIAWWEFDSEENQYCGMNHTAAIITTSSGEYVIDTTHKQFSGASGDDIYIGIPHEWMAYIVRINNGQGLVYADGIKRGNSLAFYQPPPKTKPKAPTLEIVDTKEEKVSVEGTGKKKSGSCVLF